MKPWPDAVLVLVLLMVAGLLVRGTVSAGPYPYDEADYMYAASLGVRANATDTPSLGPGDFIRIGLKRGRDSGQRSSLSELIRESDDVNLYRHQHGPLYSYWLIVTSPWRDQEDAMRSFTLAFYALTFLVIYAGCITILPGVRGRLAAILASSLYLFSYTNLRTSIELAPHALFALCAVSTLVLLARMISSGDVRYWYFSVVSTALAFVTLEIALVLLATMAGCCWLERRTIFAGWKSREWVPFTAKSLALFVGVVFLVWPAAILKLAFIKSYLVQAYLSLFRQNAYGPVSFLETWRLRVVQSPFEWLLLVLGVVAYFFRARRETKLRSLMAPFLLYGTLMLTALLSVKTDSPRYASPFLPAFALMAGCSFAVIFERWPPLPRAAITGLMPVLLLGSLWGRLPLAASGGENADRAMLALLRAEDPSGKRILVPQTTLPTIHYYFPQAHLKGYLSEDDIPAAQGAQGFDGVLRIGPLRWESWRTP